MANPNQTRFSLTDFPNTEKGGSQSAGSQQILGKRNVSCLHGGSVEAMRNQVLAIGMQYMQGNASTNDRAGNHGLHTLLGNIFQGKENRPQEFERALSQLEYRMSAQSTADYYLELMEVPLPGGQQCCEFDETLSYKWRTSDDSAINEMLRQRASVLFHYPLKNQGHSFLKGVTYVTIAFTAAGLPKDVIEQKLDALVAFIRREAEGQRRIVKEIPEVKTKRQKR